VGTARAEFAEDRKGRLKAGFLADFVVLSRDLLAVPPAEIAAIKVVRTVVGGQQVFAAT